MAPTSKHTIELWNRSPITQNLFELIEKSLENIDSNLTSPNSYLALSNEEMAKKLAKYAGMKLAFEDILQWRQNIERQEYDE